MELKERLYEGANAQASGNALFREAVERIEALESALRDMTPPLPAHNAICHVGICEQKFCGNRGRIARAQALLK